jgi:hypothetical protein
MIVAVRCFLLYLLALAYVEDRYVSRAVTIALFILGWLVVYAVARRERRRTERKL